MKYRTIIGLMLSLLIISICCKRNESAPNSPTTKVEQINEYLFYVINRYSHDTDSQTEGLIFKDGYLYESAGPSKVSKSSLRKVEITTGNMLMRHDFIDTLFAEGMTILNDKIYQLTYQAGLCFVYNMDNFTVVDTFTYSTEGWGLTHDGSNLIMSDGSSNLYVMDSVTFSKIETIEVFSDTGSVDKLNELEYIDGIIYANIHGTGHIACINRYTGHVFKMIDLWALLKGRFNDGDWHIYLANGIACDHENMKLYLTGKFWPYLFELDMVKKVE